MQELYGERCKNLPKDIKEVIKNGDLYHVCGQKHILKYINSMDQKN